MRPGSFGVFSCLSTGSAATSPSLWLHRVLNKVGLEAFVLKVKRAETPFFRSIKALYRGFVHFSIPAPRALRPLGNALYHTHFFCRFFLGRLITVLYREPLFRYRCEHVGLRLGLNVLPEAPGHTAIFFGDDVVCHGKLGIYSARVFDGPVLRVGNRVSIGHQVTFSCNREIVVEDDVLIANSCFFFDNDGHPVDAQLRAAGYPAPAERTAPVRICRYAWIGAGSYILKGVTIGEGSIIGSGSVVTTDVPPYSLAAGNPAKVIKTLVKDDVRTADSMVSR